MSDKDALNGELLLLEAYVADNPGSRSFLKLADAYRRNGRLDDAAGVLQKGLVIHPQSAEARSLLAEVLVEMGDGPGAASQLLAAAREMSRHAGVFESLAGIWEAQGKNLEAAAARDAARALSRDWGGSSSSQLNQDTATLAEIYAAQGHIDQASAIYGRLAAQRPDDPKIKARLAQLETEAGPGEQDEMLERLEALKEAALARAGA